MERDAAGSAEVWGTGASVQGQGKTREISRDVSWRCGDGGLACRAERPQHVEAGHGQEDRQTGEEREMGNGYSQRMDHPRSGEMVGPPVS